MLQRRNLLSATQIGSAKNVSVARAPEDDSTSHSVLIGKHKIDNPSMDERDDRGENKNSVFRGDNLTDNLAQLAQAPLDLARWINTSLTHLENSYRTKNGSANCYEDVNAPNGMDASKYAIRSEIVVNRLITHVQAHAQGVESSTEELISHTIARFPRSTFELSRMVKETQEVTDALQGLWDTVVAPRSTAATSIFPSEFDDNEEYVQRLQELKETQTKLKRCLNILSTATVVDTNMEKIERGIGKPVSHLSSHTYTDTVINELKESGMALMKIGGLIHRVQLDLQYLRTVDPTYGEKYRIALEQYEQVVEKMLEHECVERLVQHQTEGALEFFQPLALIGQADAVLASYAKRVALVHVERIRQMFGMEGENTEAADMNPSKVAEVLRSQLVPFLRTCLSTELRFLCELADKANSHQLAHQQYKENLEEDPVLLGSVPLRSCANAYLSPHESINKHETKLSLVAHSTAAASDAQHATVVMHTMERIIDIIGDAFNTAMILFLKRITTNKELIDCYEAVVLINAAGSTTDMPEGTPPIKEGAAGTPVRKAPPPSSLSSSLSVRNQYAAQTFLRALSALTTAFHHPSLLEAFSDRTDARLRIFARHDARQSPTYSGAHFPRVLDALVEGLWDVLRLFPEETMTLCVRRWYASLSGIFLATAAPPSAKQEDQSQVTLSRLYFTVKLVKPTLLRLQKDIKALFTASDVQQLYQDNVCLVLHMLSAELWEPLFTAVDGSIAELQERMKHIILEPVLTKTAHYLELPSWSSKEFSSIATEEAWQQQWQLVMAFTPSHVRPSEPARELGEAILGIPLTLEALRFTPADMLCMHAAESDGEVSMPLLSAADSMDELFREETASWLDGIVQAAVDDFVSNKVLQVRVDFSNLRIRGERAIAPGPGEGGVEATQDPVKRCVSNALQQLSADLDYMKNVLSAVSDNRFDKVEQVLMKLNTLLSTWKPSKILERGSFQVWKLIDEVVE